MDSLPPELKASLLETCVDISLETPLSLSAVNKDFHYVFKTYTEARLCKRIASKLGPYRVPALLLAHLAHWKPPNRLNEVEIKWMWGYTPERVPLYSGQSDRALLRMLTAAYGWFGTKEEMLESIDREDVCERYMQNKMSIRNHVRAFFKRMKRPDSDFVDSEGEEREDFGPMAGDFTFAEYRRAHACHTLIESTSRLASLEGIALQSSITINNIAIPNFTHWTTLFTRAPFVRAGDTRSDAHRKFSIFAYYVRILNALISVGSKSTTAGAESFSLDGISTLIGALYIDGYDEEVLNIDLGFYDYESSKAIESLALEREVKVMKLAELMANTTRVCHGGILCTIPTIHDHTDLRTRRVDFEVPQVAILLAARAIDIISPLEMRESVRKRFWLWRHLHLSDDPSFMMRYGWFEHYLQGLVKMYYWGCVETYPEFEWELLRLNHRFDRLDAFI